MSFIRLYLCLILLLPAISNANSPIVILGDSLSAGYGLKQNEVWVDLLAKRIAEQTLPYSIINASISGDTTAGGRHRLASIIKNHSPRIVVLELGGNDGLRGLPLDVIKRNINAIIKRCQKENIDVVLVGLNLPPNYGPHYTEQFSRLFFDLAEENKVPLVPSLLAGLEANLDLFQNDGIHPTAKAQPIMLENVWQVLAPLIHAQNVTLFRR